MTSRANLIKISRKIKTVSNDIEPAVAEWIDEMTGIAVEYIHEHRGSPEIICTEMGQVLRRRLLDRLLEPEFMKRFKPDLAEVDMALRNDWLYRVSHTARKLSPPLAPAYPVPRKDAPVMGWMIGGILGALAGTVIPAMLAVSPATQVSVIMGTAPLGVAAGILGVRWLTLQSSLLGKLMGIHSSDLMDLSQIRVNARTAVKGWLHSEIVIIAFLATLTPLEHHGADDHTDRLTDGVLAALGKLRTVPDENRLEVIDELLQEAANAGFLLPVEPVEELIWKESLLNDYEVIGVISPGDPCRVLQQPVKQNERTIIKGRITRKRS